MLVPILSLELDCSVVKLDPAGGFPVPDFNLNRHHDGANRFPLARRILSFWNLSGMCRRKR